METEENIVWYSDCLTRQEQKSGPLYHFENGWPMRQVVDGIYVTPEIYLRKSPQFGEKLTLPEAQQLCAENRAEIPSLYEILMFALAQNSIKAALDSIGVYSFPFSGENIFSECWTEENIKQDGTGKKYLLMFGCDGNKTFPEVTLVNDNLALVNQIEVYEQTYGIWNKCALTLLAGNGLSNLLISNDDVLFLQHDQKFSFIGVCKKAVFDDIFVCNTGIFQYHREQMNCLLALNPETASANNSNWGHEEWADEFKKQNNGTELFFQWNKYDWCDDREQERMEKILLYYVKNEQGLFVRKV